MGNCNSGRYPTPNRKEIVENCISLSSTELYRKGILDENNTKKGYLQNDHIKILTETAPDSITIDYSVKYNDGRIGKEKYTITVIWTSCNFGGKRPWFICPGCMTRVEKLHKPKRDRFFACRQCQNLTYLKTRTSRLTEFQNTLRCTEIRRKLGNNNPPDWPFPKRPKHMHIKTYEKLRRKHEKAYSLIRAAKIRAYRWILRN